MAACRLEASLLDLTLIKVDSLTAGLQRQASDSAIQDIHGRLESHVLPETQAE